MGAGLTLFIAHFPRLTGNLFYPVLDLVEPEEQFLFLNSGGYNQVASDFLRFGGGEIKCIQNAEAKAESWITRAMITASRKSSVMLLPCNLLFDKFQRPAGLLAG